MTMQNSLYKRYNDLVDKLNKIEIKNKEDLIPRGKVERILNLSRPRLTTLCEILEITEYRRGAHRSRYYKKKDIMRLISHLTKVA